MPTYYSYVLLEKKGGVYHVAGQIDSLPGGNFPGKIRPILFNEGGVDKLIQADGFISNDQKKAYVVYKDFYKKGRETVTANDNVTLEVKIGTNS